MIVRESGSDVENGVLINTFFIIILVRFRYL